MDMRGGLQIVHARVPLSKMFGYSTAVRSLTKGRASYSMETDQFEIAPKSVQDEIMAM
jgi:elongation factor G